MSLGRPTLQHCSRGVISSLTCGLYHYRPPNGQQHQQHRQRRFSILICTLFHGHNSAHVQPYPDNCFRTPKKLGRHGKSQNTRSQSTSSNDPNPPSHASYHTWPEAAQPHSIPNPYQIFNQKEGEAYSKSRFYELVKIYHPDRTKYNDALSSEPKDVLLERYRLVVAANAILSDPQRKEAYDRFGHGWISMTSAGHRDDVPGHMSGHKYSTYHRWYRDSPQAFRWPVDLDPMMNATWEDWERWYRKQYYYRTGTKPPHWSRGFFYDGNRRGSRGFHINKYVFFSLSLMVAVLSGVGQVTWAQETTRARRAQAQAASDETAELLNRARLDSIDYSRAGEEKQQRIRRFLRERDKYPEGEFDARAARPGGLDENVCASETVKDPEAQKFWQQRPSD